METKISQRLLKYWEVENLASIYQYAAAKIQPPPFLPKLPALIMPPASIAAASLDKNIPPILDFYPNLTLP